MDLGLKDKRALVMSSSRGLGLACATALVAEGAHVLLTGRSEDALKAAAADLTAKGPGKADYVVADLTDASTVETLASTAEEVLGGVDILVNNTGGPPPGRMADADLSVMAAQFDVMVMRVAEITARLLPAMRERGWGRIVTIASSGVIQPIPNLGLSNALRSALVGWSKSLANDVAADGVTVNMLLPGRIHTARVDQLDEAASKRTGKTLEETRAASRATIPAGRYGAPEEFGAVAAFLCSAPASYVTGGLIRCDGGAIKSV
ncbi:SDR family oxidoreductase [Jannaschia seohaensis]|uniref:3-oxoacyl-[acyl-carrier protein] reductase n=1 Tax=Jannaschia seohaensis TaxID=475081 RepID=A0A2Y9AAY2_9RHOB|nr:SDR family oxidoreductase [Jannaschia seohaensis]PWJ20915.1 3-oxoacyl-[acyl-carrier protein] reductase [Jannaschia seohaensis]SSA41325.1 3-oxoacyl-[acyl-carrier protein] reductase [Jannaschia seohaensis]